MTAFDCDVAPNTTPYCSKLTTVHTQPVLTPAGRTDGEKKEDQVSCCVSHSPNGASCQGNKRSAVSLNMSLWKKHQSKQGRSRLQTSKWQDMAQGQSPFSKLFAIMPNPTKEMALQTSWASVCCREYAEITLCLVLKWASLCVYRSWGFV